jgi:hypothetical protein
MPSWLLRRKRALDGRFAVGELCQRSGGYLRDIDRDYDSFNAGRTAFFKERRLDPLPARPAFRPGFAGPSYWWRSRRLPSTAGIALPPTAKSRRKERPAGSVPDFRAHHRASGAAITVRFALVTAITLCGHSQCYK